MKKGILGLLAWSMPFLLLAQNNVSMQSIPTKAGPRIEEGKGINWITGLSWEQIKQKAKQENKYIFIDAYTTWCGPCKMMDKYVYLNDTVGNYFNEHFIAVKAQMDVTEKDDQNIKNWYKDAKKIEGEYAVTGFPSLIFLSPKSTLLYKMEGFRTVQNFVDTAKLVLTNGTVYNDPYKEYKTLVSEFRQGTKHYDKMLYMIKTALKLNDADLVRLLFKDHFDYVSNLAESKRYTKENIELWASFDLGFTSKAFYFFYKEGEKIDQVMNQKGFATDVVDRSIQTRIVDSFFKMQKGETTTITGVKVPNSEIMFGRLPVRKDGKIEPDYIEADWKKLEKMMRKNFTKDYVKRNILTAKMRWYEQHQNMIGASKMYFSKLDRYPPLNFDFSTKIEINQRAWKTFLYVNDRKLLKTAAEWMEIAIQRKPDQLDVFIDTYANLLYKMGQTDKAIQWEEKALDATNGKREIYKIVIEQMKNGFPTYLEEGAIWTKK